MTNSVNELSEKEKEALRLLFAGHDAKSSARELDLSFHTINDRLRSARRKLGVSSSREAARLLVEAETLAVPGNATPESVAHTHFGVASAGHHANDDDSVATEDGDTPRPIWQRKGVLIMTISLAIVAMAAALSTSGEDAGRADGRSHDNLAQKAGDGAPASGSEVGVEQHARDWLALVDNGNAEASRAAAGAAMRERHSQGVWELGVALRQNNWGVPLRRNLVETKMRPAEESGALGDFAILTFESEFSNRAQVTEQVTMQRVGGDWVVADYDGDDGTDD
ncbi:helix-turn-helix domain-containing protein [Aurantiacibacter rhizosphaerae]|uniref:DUF4019 domain-containing protein n=1 Tax=Aurantiacibacter rhizosphaerae TaxID=2691582 RepID=A0A844XBR4_9SPHN|nr:DUF4019 domain-containing protein [Aurantiacibacter rhizosphaerae]MWV27847.1 DUF4019 domain-containing protein [Aurantiacibacter rhizosphaerae]